MICLYWIKPGGESTRRRTGGSGRQDRMRGTGHRGITVAAQGADLYQYAQARGDAGCDPGVANEGGAEEYKLELGETL